MGGGEPSVINFAINEAKRRVTRAKQFRRQV